MINNSMLSLSSHKKIVVLGAGGFIGRHLSMALDKIDAEVHLFNRSELSDIALTKAQFHPFNFPKDLEHYKDEISGADVLFFLVNTHKQTEKNPVSIEVFKKKCEALTEFCQKQKVKKIVFTSSATVYGQKQILPLREGNKKEPVSHYGQEKSVLEDVLLQTGKVVILRLTNPYGPLQCYRKGQGVIPFMFNRIETQEMMPIYGKRATLRDFIYIDDVIKAILKAGYIDTEQKVFNIGSGQALSLGKLIKHVEKVSGKTLRHKNERRRPFDVRSNQVDISLAQAYLDWTPEVSFEEGLKRSWEWFKTNN